MNNNRIIGVLAHVDAGKTTLSEAMLYLSGTLRKAGRVDHGDTFLDTNDIERDRGITIFSSQARMKLGDLDVILLGTVSKAIRAPCGVFWNCTGSRFSCL